VLYSRLINLNKIMKANANDANDQDKEPCEQHEYFHLLRMLNDISHSHPDISTALSYAATKSSDPTKQDFKDLLQGSSKRLDSSEYPRESLRALHSQSYEFYLPVC
jgi:hypothetical protein